MVAIPGSLASASNVALQKNEHIEAHKIIYGYTNDLTNH
jgi:hypothetical protein